MNTKTSQNQMETGREAFQPQSALIIDYPWIPNPAQTRKSLWSDLEAVKSMETTSSALTSTYLAANMNFKNIPLKEFMDQIEKRILLTCLDMTHGHQKNAAAILGLKPTALFEKMRKHSINCRRIKFSSKLSEAPSRELK
jgi:DNA-binding NtrC family response regulator